MGRIRMMGAAALLTLLGCADTGTSPSEQIYESSLALWNREGPASYDMVLERECICNPAEIQVTIEVRNRQVTARYYTGTDPVEPVPGGSVGLYPDVPGLFAFVRQAMDDDVFYLSATYDPTYGYPNVVQLDRTVGRDDDNVIYRVLTFTAVP